jgi:DNA primase large subunit
MQSSLKAVVDSSHSLGLNGMQTIQQILPAITAIAGAVIGALISYLFARRQFKASVLSKNRQDWMNKLRDLLSEYEATLYDVHANFQLGGLVRSTKEGLSDMRKANLIRSQVKLMINPKEDDHVQLLELMQKMDNSASHQGEQYTKTFAALDKKFVTLSQSILKREWERVKKGK